MTVPPTGPETPPVTREEAIRRAGEHLADGALACQQMTPREQAESAWTPTCRRSVDELEQMIMIERGYTDPEPSA